jgi:ribose 5-phosphate isomerase B
MKIVIGSDHAGFELKEKVKTFLLDNGYQVLDKGCYSNERVDYSDFGHAVAESVLKEEDGRGIILCGSGIGISISANRHKGIRAANAWNAEIAKLSRQHNDANVLALPARFLSETEAFSIVSSFLSEAFEGGRHTDRIKKIELA